MKLVLNSRVLSDSECFVSAYTLVNSILGNKSSFLAVYGALASEFTDDGHLDANALFTASIAVGRVLITTTNRADANEFIMEAFPYGDENRFNERYIHVSDAFVSTMNELEMTRVQKNHLFFLLFVSLLHECAHMLTPTFNTLAGKPFNSGTPEKLGKITIGSRQVADCGYGLENNMFNQAFLGTSSNDYNTTILVRTYDPTIEAQGTNLLRKLVPNNTISKVRRKLEQWERRLWWSECINKFPWDMVLLLCNFELLTEVVPPPTATPSTESTIIGGKLRVHIPNVDPFTTPPKRHRITSL